MLGLPRMHRQQPAGVGEVTEELRGTLRCEAQQAFAKRDGQAVAGNQFTLNRKPAQREAGGKIRQIAARFTFVKRLVRFGGRVKRMPHQQRLFCLRKIQRFVTQVCPVVAQIDGLPGVGMAFKGALLKPRQRFGIE